MAITEERKTLIDETVASVDRIQSFDVTSLPRVEELGSESNFLEAVQYASRNIELFQQVSQDVIPEFPKTWLTALKQAADAEVNRYDQILNFSVEEGNLKARRTSIISQIEQAYETTFERIWQAIAYSVRRSTDYSRLEMEARASIQSIQDRTASIEQVLKSRQDEAESVLTQIRKIAAEQGVSQQAIYFKDEASRHSDEAATWLKATIGLTIALGIYAVITLFLHKWSILAPTTAYETAQLAVSKLLIFGTIASFLILSSRNYMAHRHNAVVNKHRQNSLVTYQALVDAAGDDANRDIVLTKAAESIFSSQPTGFTKADSGDSGATSLVNLSPALIKATGGTHTH